MIRAITNVFRVPERRIKALLALLTLSLAFAVYRAGFYVPRPGINQSMLARYTRQPDSDATGQAAELSAIFTGADEVSQP